MCCAIVFGSLHGLLQDDSGTVIANGQVTLRAADGQRFGNCAETLTSSVTEGRYAFDGIPFGIPLVYTATADGHQRTEGTATVPKGPITYLTITLKRN